MKVALFFFFLNFIYLFIFWRLAYDMPKFWDGWMGWWFFIFLKFSEVNTESVFEFCHISYCTVWNLLVGDGFNELCIHIHMSWWNFHVDFSIIGGGSSLWTLCCWYSISRLGLPIEAKGPCLCGIGHFRFGDFWDWVVWIRSRRSEGNFVSLEILILCPVFIILKLN